MDAFNTVRQVGTAIGQTALGGWGASEFGKKGLAIGAGVGLGAFALGESVNQNNLDENGNPTLKGAVISGAIAGTVQSSFSTMQELYAFHNPNSVASINSVNTTTTAMARVNLMESFTQKETWKQLHNVVKNSTGSGMEKFGSIVKGVSGVLSEKGFTMEDRMTNIIEDAITMDKGEGISSMYFDRLAKATRNSGDDPFKSLFEMGKQGVGALKDGLKATVDAADNNNGLWFARNAEDIAKIDPELQKRVKMNHTSEGYSFDVNFNKNVEEMVNNIVDNKPINHGDTVNRRVNIEFKEASNERMGKYVTAYGEQVESSRQFFNKTMDRLGVKVGGIETVEDYSKYLTNIKPGALGTYTELLSKGVYAKEAPLVRKAAGLAYETFSGSPIWARTVNKQIESGVATKVKDAMGKISIKGGSKVARVAALVADSVILGGGLFALGAAAMHIASMPFQHKNKNDSSVKSNRAYNPI